MSDYLRRPSFGYAVDQALEMDRALRGVTPAWQEALRLGSALETFRTQWDQLEAAKHSIGEAFRVSSSLNDHVQAMIDAQPRIGGLVEDYSRRLAADLTSIIQPAVYQHMEALTSALVESAKFPHLELAMESVRAAQEVWTRSVAIPFRDFESLSFNARDLLRKAVESLVDARVDDSEQPETGEDVAEIEKARDRIATTFQSTDPEAVLRDLREFLAEARSQKNTRWKPLLLALFVNLLSALIFQIGLTTWESKASRPAITSIRSTARAIQRSGQISSPIRVVVAQSLIVRAGPGQRTRPVGRLYLGDVVTVLKVRNRSWALVEFRHQQEEIVVQGWVFRRYLQTLRGSI